MRQLIALLIGILTMSNSIAFGEEAQPYKWVIQPQFQFTDVDVLEAIPEVDFDQNEVIQFARGIKLVSGLSYVKDNGKYGIINDEGKLILNITHTQQPFLCGYVNRGKTPSYYENDDLVARFVVDGNEYTLNGAFVMDHAPHEIYSGPTVIDIETGRTGYTYIGDGFAVYGQDQPHTGIAGARGIKMGRGEYGEYPKEWTNKYGFIKDNTVLVSPKYDKIYEFNDGMGAFKLNNKWGFIDSTGKEVITAQYDRVSSFVNGLAPVSLNGKAGFINKQGKNATGMIFDATRPVDAASSRAWVKMNGKWGVIEFIQFDLDINILEVVHESKMRQYKVLTAWDYTNKTTSELPSNDGYNNTYHIMTDKFNSKDKIKSYVEEYTSIQMTQRFLDSVNSWTKEKDGVLYLLNGDPLIPDDCRNGHIVKKAVSKDKIIATIKVEMYNTEIVERDVVLVLEGGKWKLDQYIY